MGLVATVRCRCFEEGKTRPPEFDIHLLKIFRDGRLILKLPESIDEPTKKSLNEAKLAWERNCCTHSWRYLVNEWIASWQGVRMLRDTMQALGCEHFPILCEQLPTINAGEILSVDCQKALLELDVLRQKLSKGLHQVMVLEDVATQAELCVSDALQESCFYIASEGELWLKNGHFCVLQYGDEANTGDCIKENGNNGQNSCRGLKFYSAGFTQELVHDALSGTYETIFTDMQSGQVHKVRGDMMIRRAQALDGRSDVVPAELRVFSRVSHVQDYAYILTPLTKVLQASVFTGHSLVWG